MTPTYLTAQDVATRLGWKKRDRVYVLIRTGQLKAFNIATNPMSRPDWRIDPADFDAFVAGRAVVVAPPPAARRRRSPEKVTAYF
jgi:hypothetical protein